MIVVELKDSQIWMSQDPYRSEGIGTRNATFTYPQLWTSRYILCCRWRWHESSFRVELLCGISYVMIRFVVFWWRIVLVDPFCAFCDLECHCDHPRQILISIVKYKLDTWSSDIHMMESSLNTNMSRSRTRKGDDKPTAHEICQETCLRRAYDTLDGRALNDHFVDDRVISLWWYERSDVNIYAYNEMQLEWFV